MPPTIDFSAMSTYGSIKTGAIFFNLVPLAAALLVLSISKAAAGAVSIKHKVSQGEMSPFSHILCCRGCKNKKRRQIKRIQVRRAVSPLRENDD